jgi:spore germination protein
LLVVIVGVGLATVIFGSGDDDTRGNASDIVMTVGYVPYWDQTRGFEVVDQNPGLFDEISPVWYAPTPEGGVQLTDQEHAVVDSAVVEALQAAGVRVVPTVTSLRGGEWDPQTVQTVIRDPEIRRAHVDELVKLAVR